jgi:membrane protein implicated in regulation of membrane protease activity
MKFVFFLCLALAAAVLIIGTIIGLAFKLIGFAVAALLVVAGVSWVMRKLGRPTDVDRNRLTR